MIQQIYERQQVNTFKAIPASSQEISQNFKRVEVKNPAFVELPGCVNIKEIRLDGILLPSFEDRDVLDNKQGKTRPIRVPLYALMQSIHGTVLVRSEQSNDGVWQVGSTLWVDAEWEDESLAPESVAAPRRGRPPLVPAAD